MAAEKNLDWFMMNNNINNNSNTTPTGFHDFPMPENHNNNIWNHHHHRQYPSDPYQNYDFPMNGTNTTLPGTNSNYDFFLESEFNRLSLSAPPPQSPAAFMAAAPAYDGGVADFRNYNSSSVNNMMLNNGFGFSYGTDDLNRMRVLSAASAAQMAGLYMQPQNHNNFDEFCFNNNGYDLGNNGYNLRMNSNSNSNGGGYNYNRPREYRNGSRNLAGLNLNWNGNNNPFSNSGIRNLNRNVNNHYSNGIESNNLNKRSSFSSLDDLRGKIHLVAKDQYGCRFLQKKFEEGNPEAIRVIFSEVKDHICDLMMDQFGNYLVQKFFEVCSVEQITQLLLLVINDERSLVAICLDMHGTRAMQSLIEHLRTPEQRSVLTSVLKRITVILTKDANGHHVISHCLKFFPTEDNKHILNVVADNCYDIAIDKNGCCVIQQCVAHAQGEPRDRLVAEITSNAMVLSQHPYGNYVVQYILGLRIPPVTSEILAQLSGKIIELSMNKYGSNVVEKCLKESEPHHVFQIVDEINRGGSQFLSLLQDPFGNYVAQSALSSSKGEVHHTMVNLINVHYPFLHSHPHGKRVLACTKVSKRRV